MFARRGLRKSREGNTLVEFALLAPIFFMIVTGLIEFVLYEYKSYALDHVVYEATRNLQTGEVQQSEDMGEAFNSAACEAARTLINCNDIVFDVRSYDSIADIDFPPVVFDENGRPANFVFQPGGAYKYSVVRAALEYQFVTPMMGKLLGVTRESPAIINAYYVVRNEPWN
ncbi:MAG: TadE/TadG family type IV pilus assembly protein [Hyphomonadaceae bacterium]